MPDSLLLPALPSPASLAREAPRRRPAAGTTGPATPIPLGAPGR